MTLDRRNNMHGHDREEATTMLDRLKKVGLLIVFAVVSVTAGFVSKPLINATVEWVNAPPPPVSIAGQALIETLEKETNWRLAKNGNALVNEKLGMILHLNQSGKQTVCQWDDIEEKCGHDTKTVDWFESTDFVHIKRVANKLKAKLLLEHFNRKVQ
jgi:hypothetical protein